MWDLIVSVPDHCLSFYFSFICGIRCLTLNYKNASLWTGSSSQFEFQKMDRKSRYIIL